MRSALADPAILGDALPGPSWRNWRVLLIAACGERLTAPERRIFTKLTGRRREPGRMVSTLLVVAGRRSGKTRAMACLSVYLACCIDWSADLSLGERGLALFLSPVEKQAERAFRFASSFLDHVPLLREQIANRTANCIELSNQVDLEVQAANWRHSRGATCVSICLDESAFLRSADNSANSDVEIITALRPSLATTSGPLLLTSSPSAMEGAVFKIFERHFGEKGDASVLVVKADSRSLNPTLRQEVVDQAYQDDPAAAAAEFGGEFRAPLSNYLERAMVQRCVEVGVAARPKIPFVDYVAFVDVSGGSGQDSYCCAVGHMQSHLGVEIIAVDHLFEARPPLNPDQVTKQLVDEVLRPFGISHLVGDAYGSQWPISAFAKHGISYQVAGLSASEIYLHSLPCFTAGRVQLLDHPRAVDQLCGLKRKVGQAGRETISHIRGGHDDLANVICGLIWRLTPPVPAIPDCWPEFISAPRNYFGEASLSDPLLGIPHGRAGDRYIV